MNLLEEIKRVATLTRDWAEETFYREHVDRLYFVDEDLCGMCAIAAFKLFENIKAIGAKATKIAVMQKGAAGHVFVEVHDSSLDWPVVVDITATQFSMSSIEIVPRHVAHEYFWNAKHRFDRIADAKDFLLTLGWKAEFINHDIY